MFKTTTKKQPTKFRTYEQAEKMLSFCPGGTVYDGNADVRGYYYLVGTQISSIDEPIKYI